MYTNEARKREEEVAGEPPHEGVRAAGQRCRQPAGPFLSSLSLSDDTAGAPSAHSSLFLGTDADRPLSRLLRISSPLAFDSDLFLLAMSSGKADGHAAFDFLSNIPFSAQDAPNRSTKKLKSSQPRTLASSKQGSAPKGSKSTTNEPVEAKKGNSRSTTVTSDDSPSKQANTASERLHESLTTPMKTKSTHHSKHGHSEHRDHRYALHHPISDLKSPFSGISLTNLMLLMSSSSM